MSAQDQLINRSLVVRMAQLATTAARKERVYITKNGTKRIIKARPARQGLLPMGETTIWDKVRSGEFPKPVKLSERVTVWRLSDVQAWMKSKGMEV